MLEKRMKEQKRKQKEESKQTAQIDRAALLEKINQLQVRFCSTSTNNISTWCSGSQFLGVDVDFN